MNTHLKQNYVHVATPFTRSFIHEVDRTIIQYHEQLCRHMQPGTRAGTGNSCFADLTNLAGFCRTSGSGGRDRIEGIGTRKEI